MGKPRLFIDARMVTEIPHGFARYVVMIAHGLLHVKHGRELAYEPVFLVNPGFKSRALSEFATCRVESLFLNPSEIFEIPRVLKGGECKLYHSPTFSSLIRMPCPWMQTLCDLNHLSFGSWPQKMYYKMLLKPFAKKAKALLTISEFSKKEILEWTGLPQKSVEVLYIPMDPHLAQSSPDDVVQDTLSKFGLERGKYFFNLSNSKPHKNLDMLVEAYRAYADRQPSNQKPWSLALTVKDYSSVPGVIGLGGLQDEEIRALLFAAGALVFPSLYEGFGLPPVEAAALGVPVVVSKIPPHLEGLADLQENEAIWVDPRNFQGWVDALNQAAHGKIQRVSAKTRSKLMERFDVGRFGLDMDRIYTRVLGLKP